MPTFSKSSAEKLSTCDKRLQDLFAEVVKIQDCTVTCGFRGEKEQNDAYANGFSRQKFPNGKHNILPSLAVDVVPYPIDYSNIERLKAFALLVKDVADKMGIDVEAGADWADFTDYPHYQVKPNA